MVCLAKSKVINLKMAHGRAKTCREKLRNIILVINNSKQVVFDCILLICFVIR
jgi:hypothetical protein